MITIRNQATGRARMNAHRKCLADHRAAQTVIESPVIVEVRAFSQPEEVDRLEDKIVTLLNKPLAAPAAPDESDKVLARKLIHGLGSINKYEDRIIYALEALATVRAEEREAAFKDAGEIVRACGLRSEKYPDRYITAAAFKTRVECALESARTGKVEG